MRIALLLAGAWLLSCTVAGADSARSALNVSVAVARRCNVSAASTLEVRCARTPGAAVQTSVNGRTSAPTPLTYRAPGAVGTSIPLGATPRSRVVTILF